MTIVVRVTTTPDGGLFTQHYLRKEESVPLKRIVISVNLYRRAKYGYEHMGERRPKRNLAQVARGQRKRPQGCADNVAMCKQILQDVNSL